jgi:hypothetical protein
LLIGFRLTIFSAQIISAWGWKCWNNYFFLFFHVLSCVQITHCSEKHTNVKCNKGLNWLARCALNTFHKLGPNFLIVYEFFSSFEICKMQEINSLRKRRWQTSYSWSWQRGYMLPRSGLELNMDPPMGLYETTSPCYIYLIFIRICIEKTCMHSMNI